MMNEIIKMANNLGWHADYYDNNDIIIFDKVIPETPSYVIGITIDNIHNTIAARVVLAEEFYKILNSRMIRHSGIGGVAVYHCDDLTPLGYINNHDYSFHEFERALSNFTEKYIKKEA